ncbi:alpha-L-rhamnosidase [Agromyces mangrovi Wang et al. 2018]|uniref:alpha-L-rhamnosidase n=1 Tax=Agromyces mangrovi TaxID=1858653 RepID=UPI002573C046|nr:alpha-L-rhamnosidase [Agromyces mangrovi]BDZ65588.1 alpha-L-rhamnosidase [Agromyces mangrovi]
MDQTAARWTARMIAPDDEFGGAPLLRREVTLDTGHGAVEEATLRYSALGVVEAWLNGRPVSADLLTPGWSSYEWRVRFAETDVTALVADGANVLGLALGNGWYRGRLGWAGNRNLYGDELGALAELSVRFADGHEQVIGTDASWQAGPGATLANDLYDGQTIDARLRDDAWLGAGFDGAGWVGVHELDFDLEKLEPYVGPPVRRVQELAPVSVTTSPSGAVLVDFGQNLVGFVRVAVRGEAGAEVVLRHAEVLEHDELGTRPLRSARATDRYLLSGGDDVFEPTLTFHGFRYVEVSGWPGGVDAIAEGALTAIVVSSDLRRIGRMQTSNPLLDRLHENAVWGMRGNFLDVPTDCPQRDERLGWTGDIAAFAPSAAFLFDVRDFLRDWLVDLDLEQRHADGIVPLVVPDAIKYFELPPEFPTPEAMAVWSDAAAWVPWAVYEAYGDERVLREAFPAIAAHLRRVRGLLDESGVWGQGMQLGDWLDPDAPPEAPHQAKADGHVVATLAAYQSATIAVDAAHVLGDADAQAEFAALADTLRAGFHAEYVRDGVIHSDASAVYALAIVTGIVDGADLEFAGNRLAELVAESGYRISTGFAGTPFVTDALTSTGHLDAAYRLLLQTECPSWLYPVTMGATTIWERWDSMLPDGTINPGEMTSFNHYALGAVVDWMHRVVGGLAPLEPGYARILVAPQPGGDLTWAETSLETPRGLARVRWDLADGRLDVVATVPEGAEAVLRLPGASDETVGAGVHERSVAFAS